MNRNEALSLLGLEEGASTSEIDAVLTEKQSEVAGRIAAAPTDVLRAKYEQMQSRLNEVKSALSTPKQHVFSSSPLSATKMADLPGVAPSHTGGGAHAGASLGIQPGHVLANRFEIKEQIGEGGMGAVYRAFDRTRRNDIAIKVLLPGLLSSQQAKERFLNEARVSSELSHPNIVNVFDVQSDGAFNFITMELLQGQSLRGFLENHRTLRQEVEVAEALEIVGKIADALAYAHEFTVHRDIKPENVWLTEDGKVKLMDFGIARMMHTSQLTQTGAAMGTAYYMPPEQLKGRGEIDGRADQYSLSVMLYEMLAGEVPAGRMESLRKVRKEVPAGLSAAVDKALSPKAEDRFSDISEFATALTKKGSSLSMPSFLMIGRGDMSKALGTGASVLAGCAVLFVMVSSGVLADLFESEGTKQARYQHAVKLEGEVKDLAERLQNSERMGEEKLRDAKNEVRTMEQRGSGSARQEATKLLERQQKIVDMLSVSVYGSSRLTELKGNRTLGEMLNRDKKYKESVPVLEQVKEGYQGLMANVEAAGDMLDNYDVALASKKRWESYGKDTKTDILPQHKQYAAAFRSASNQRDQGDFVGAMSSFNKVRNDYDQLYASSKDAMAALGKYQEKQGEWVSFRNHYSSYLKNPPSEEHAKSFHAAGDQALATGDIVGGKAKFLEGVQAYVALLSDKASIGAKNAYDDAAREKADQERREAERIAELARQEALRKAEEERRIAAAEARRKEEAEKQRRAELCREYSAKLRQIDYGSCGTTELGVCLGLQNMDGRDCSRIQYRYDTCQNKLEKKEKEYRNKTQEYCSYY